MMAFLRANGITYVTADEPQFGNLATVPFFSAATADASYFRFHGRNRENWLKKRIDTSLRYDYVYPEEEIREFVPHILDADKKGKLVFAMFNNCHGAAAIRNARRIQEMSKPKKNKP